MKSLILLCLILLGCKTPGYAVTYFNYPHPEITMTFGWDVNHSEPQDGYMVRKAVGMCQVTVGGDSYPTRIHKWDRNSYTVYCVDTDGKVHRI